MKEVKHYVCEICGGQYNDKSKAHECEASHKKLMGIHHYDYQPFTVSKHGYPIKIYAKMSDGKIVLYKKLRGEDS